METSTLSVQTLPISKIKPNVNNPRHLIQPEAVETLAASFKAVGQETPIKVRPLTPEERAANPDFEYELIGGHIRLEAAKKLGWETVFGLVLTLNPDQAELAAILDNQGEDMHWLDWYQAIERRWNTGTYSSQLKLSQELGISQMTVSRALRVTSLLTPAAREVVQTQCLKNQDADLLSERAVRALIDLENAQMVEKTLNVVIDRQMTESEAKKLVKWVQAGNEAKTYGQKLGIATAQNAPIGAGPRNDSYLDSDDPYAHYWEALPDQIQVTRGKKGYRVVIDLAANEVVPVVYGAMSNWEYLKAQCGEKEDVRYRQALPQVHKEAIRLRDLEKTVKAKMEGDRLAELDAKAKAKAQKTLKKLGVSSVDLGVNDPKPNPENHPPKNGAKGLIEKMGEALQQKTGLNPKEVKEAVESNLAKDAKQALNYQIRRGMREFLKKLIN